MAPEQLEVLRSCPLFDGLTTEEILSVTKEAEAISLAEGESVFGEGESSRGAYVVLEGAVGVRSHILEEGDHHVPFRPVIVKLEAGQPFGEFALLDSRPRSAEVFAITSCRLLVLQDGFLDRIAAEAPELGYQVMKNVATLVVGRARDTNNKLCCALEWGWRASGFDRIG